MPNPAFVGGGLLMATADPTIVAVTAIGDEGKDQELLAPLSPKQPPSPSHNGSTGGCSAISRHE